MTSATHTPGSWVAISGPDTWLLVDLPPTDERIARCWAAISQDCDADAVLDELASAGVRATPAFALVHVSDGGGHVVARRTGRVTVTSVSGDNTIAADAVVSWVEASIGSDVVSLELSGPPETASDVALPMASGVTMAARIRVQVDVSDPSTNAPARPTSGASRKPRASRSQEAPAVPVPVAEPESEPSVAAEEVPEPRPTAEESESVEAPPSYDHLFGATQRPTEVPSPGDLVGDEEAPRSATETAIWQTVSPLEPSQAVPEEAVGEPDESELAETGEESSEPLGDDVIDALPWEAPAPVRDKPRKKPPKPNTPPALASHSDDSAPPTGPTPIAPTTEATVDRSSLRAAAIPVPGPTVLAGYCPVGHLTPPHAPRCRVCGAAMGAGQEPFEIARPPLGVLRLSTGDVVTLDRPVVLGRAPEIPADAAERPHALRLVSPENDISRNHAEVVLDGWHVYVRDLNSTNGTEVTLPGQQPMRLRPGELQLLENGATVSLADEMSFTFEVEG